MKKQAFEKMVKAILANGKLDKLSYSHLRIYHYGDMELTITHRFISIYRNVRVPRCYRQERIIGCDLKDGFIF